MGIRELWERYGRTEKGREPVGAVIGTELPCGSEALDASAGFQSRHVAARSVTEAMAAKIALRYEVKSEAVTEISNGESQRM